MIIIFAVIIISTVMTLTSVITFSLVMMLTLVFPTNNNSGTMILGSSDTYCTRGQANHHREYKDDKNRF